MVIDVLFSPLFFPFRTPIRKFRLSKQFPLKWERLLRLFFSSHVNNYTYWQTPPLYSAIKIKGKKLYEYARQGLKVEIPPREVTISSIKLVDYNPAEGKIKLIAECSKGTYIRSLVQDIAAKIGTIATLSQLRRISSGPFRLHQAIKLDEISKDKIQSLIK